MTRFGKVTPAVLAELGAIVGPGGVRTDAETIAVYAHDETEDRSCPPEAVITPATTDQVSRIMTCASHNRIPVTPRGAGTGLSGGALPIHGGICLSLERMDRILEIDAEDLMAVVEPGVITGVLQAEVEKHGLYYPPDPASSGSCMIGGNVAENAGGPRAVKYGVTRDWVAGLEAVLADGTVFSTGGKLRKNASGYDLAHLLVGSEGTLAIVTRVVLRLIPLPSHRTALAASFDDVASAASAVTAVFGVGLIPSAVEFMEGEAWRLGAARIGRNPIGSGRAAYLLLEVDGNDRAQVESEAIRVGEVCADSGAAEVVLADSPARQRDLWAVRRAIGEAVKSVAPYREEDTVVPRRQVPALLSRVRAIVDRHRLRAVCYGHAGDGNIHINLLKGDEGSWSGAPDAAVREIFEVVASLGGKISGEHGIGCVQRDYLPIAHDAAEIALMRAIKSTFDPAGILNPGKVLPEA